MAVQHVRTGWPTDSTIRRKRFAATSEQHKLLQRNIHHQAEAIRNAQDRAECRKRQEALDRLTKVDAVTDPASLTAFINEAIAMVERAMTPVLPDDIAAWDVEVIR